MEGLDITAENGAGMTNNNLLVPSVGGHESCSSTSVMLPGISKAG